MSRIAMLVLVATTACGSPSIEADVTECETADQMHVLAISAADFGEWSASPTIAGQHVIANVSGILGFDPTRYTSASYAVDLCDGSTVELYSANEQRREIFGAAGPWTVGAPFDRSHVSWVDPDGHVPDRVIFESPASCLLRIADGLAVVDAGGILWFHDEPADSDVEAIALAHDVLVPTPSSGFDNDASCSTFTARSPVVEGDTLLIMERDGPLFRIAIPSGERETIIDSTVAEIAVLDDSRHILWLEGPKGNPECCDAWVRDRATGDDVHVGHEQILGALEWRGRWVARHLRAPPDTIVLSTTFLDVETGVTLSLDGEWELEAQLSDERLLVRSRDDGAHIFDTATEILEPIDFPPPLSEPRYADGVLGFATTTNPRRGTLKLLRFADGAIVDLAEVTSPYARLRDETIVFVDRADDADAGDLVFLRDGERHIIDSGVVHLEIPFYGTDRELPEVMYMTHDPARAGLWRYVLP